MKLRNFLAKKNYQLKRYPVHSGENGEKKMDLYIYQLDKDIKIAYLSVAKCASNEIRNILKTLTGDQKRLEINVNNKNDSRLENLIIFSFIRNPWERFHSAFNMIFGKTSLEAPIDFLNFSKFPDGCNKADPGHWSPQYDQLITEKGEILPEYIGDINSLYSGIDNIIKESVSDEKVKDDLRVRLRNIQNQSKKQHVKNKDFTDTSFYIKYYNTKTYENVKEYLKTDIELFNYSFGLHQATLTNLSLFYGLDKNKAVSHNYMPNYEEVLGHKKNEVKALLEIGVGGVYDLSHTLAGGDPQRNFYKSGNSLRMWRDYFINANVYGMDIREDLMFTEDRIKTFIANQHDENDLRRVITEIKSKLDVIIDDGSHDPNDQVFSFINLRKYLALKGVYIIEDIPAPYIEKFKDLSIFPPEARSHIENNFQVKYFDTREGFASDDFMMVLKRIS